MNLPEGLKARVVTSIVVDWFDLDDYLKVKYDCEGTHLPLEQSNDTDIHVSAYNPASIIDAWDMEALDRYKTDALEGWNVGSVVRIAQSDGHLPISDYIIRISW